MKRSFSFSEKPVLFILQRFPSLLPGIDKVVSVYFDKDVGRLNAYSIFKVKSEYLLEESRVNDPGDSLEKLRKDSARFLWIQSEDVPFEISSNNNLQLTIFNELNNNILLLRTLNDHDGLNDLFFIYFNNNPSNFGIVDSKKIITTENKTIIGHLLKNAIDTILLGFREDLELFISHSENNQTVIHELYQTRKELAVIRDKNRDGIVHLCKSYLADLSREYGCNFVFSNEAIIKLREFGEDLSLIRIMIEKAAHYAQTSQINGNLKEIVIHDHHLIYNLTQNQKQAEHVPLSEQVSDIPVRYTKTFVFLNKLENAAQAVKSKNLLLTSVNVGHEFPSPITPSAITDALKNHQSKILYLFNVLPTRWRIIRSEFRPVQNILNPKSERQKRTG